MFLVVYVFYEFKAESTHAVAYLYRGAVGSLFAGYDGALWLHGEVYEAVAESGAEPEGAYQLFVKQFEEKQPASLGGGLACGFCDTHGYLGYAVAADIAAAEAKYGVLQLPL